MSIIKRGKIESINVIDKTFLNLETNDEDQIRHDLNKVAQEKNDYNQKRILEK
jgi:hypothetical protein